MQKLIDVHTHVQFSAFGNETDTAIKRALDAGIWLINVGTDKETSAKAIEIAEKYQEGVWATVGLHPNEIDEVSTKPSYSSEPGVRALQRRAAPLRSRADTPTAVGDQAVGAPRVSSEHNGFTDVFDFNFYKKLAEHPKVVAIGECGLDSYRFKNEDLRFKKKQEDVFIKQIELAAELKKPLMIHCRNAFGDLIDILKSYSLNLKSSGIVHFFSGTKKDAKQLMELGFSFSFGGVITFARDYDEVIKYIPLESIVLETDAPYVAPAPYRGKRNEPLYMIKTAKKLAELKGVYFEEIASVTTANAKRIFALN